MTTSERRKRAKQYRESWIERDDPKAVTLTGIVLFVVMVAVIFI